MIGILCLLVYPSLIKTPGTLKMRSLAMPAARLSARITRGLCMEAPGSPWSGVMRGVLRPF